MHHFCTKGANMKEKKKWWVRLSWGLTVVFLSLGLIAGGASGVSAAPGEADKPGVAYPASPIKMAVAIISFSPYSAWYIVKEKKLARNIDLEVQIIEGVAEKNAAIASGQVQVILNTLDSTSMAVCSDVPIKIIAIPALSYGLDAMVVTKDIKSLQDFAGKTWGADYGYIDHMWMLENLKRVGIPFKSMKHISVLPQESAAAFLSGNLDIDCNALPFTIQSLKRPGSHVLMTSLDNRTWERGLISESLAVNEKFLKEKPEAVRELMRAYFEAIDWWKKYPDEANKIIAKGLDWPVEDVEINNQGAVMMTLSHNGGAFGVGDGKPVCMDIPEGAPITNAPPVGWGKIFFDGAPDCVKNYVPDTWKLYMKLYEEDGVIPKGCPPEKGIDTSVLQWLYDQGYDKKYTETKWIGRAGKYQVPMPN
jgi:NitT/TauT family transport system substrate-binding protein